MIIDKKDPFGFNKAINLDKLKDPKVVEVLENAFKNNPMYMTIKERKEHNKKMREKNVLTSKLTEEPNISYKKAVNALKRKTTFK